jgi:serine/threonine protein kinase
LENIRYNVTTGSVKLLDFGFASFYSSEQALKTNCGSPCYAAPEIYDNTPYDGALVDVWSLGICLYGMVVGALPFDGPDFKTLASKVRLGRISYPKHLSRPLIDLIAGMLNINPAKRSKIDAIIRHVWVNLNCRSYPVHEDELLQQPVIDEAFVQMMYATSHKNAGNLLYEDVKIKTEVRNQEGNQEFSTDEDSTGEQDADKALSRMTVKEHKSGKIWWKRLWTQISRVFIGKEDTTGVNTIRLSVRDLLPTQPIQHIPYNELLDGHSRVRTDGIPERIPSVKNHRRYRLWGAGRR